MLFCPDLPKQQLQAQPEAPTPSARASIHNEGAGSMHQFLKLCRLEWTPMVGHLFCKGMLVHILDQGSKYLYKIVHTESVSFDIGTPSRAQDTIYYWISCMTSYTKALGCVWVAGALGITLGVPTPPHELTDQGPDASMRSRSASLCLSCAKRVVLDRRREAPGGGGGVQGDGSLSKG